MDGYFDMVDEAKAELEFAIKIEQAIPPFRRQGAD